MDMPEASWELTILEADPPVTGLGALAVGDLDGDGELEIVVGEHDPFKPYRARNRQLV
jgi:hypothetical protein